MKPFPKIVGGALILSAVFFMSCQPTVNLDAKKVYVCGTCGKEYDTKDAALNCDNPPAGSNAPLTSYKINYVWPDYVMEWRLSTLTMYYNGYTYGKPNTFTESRGYTEYTTSDSNDSQSLTFQYTRKGYDGGPEYNDNLVFTATNENGMYQKSFLSFFCNSVDSYSDIDFDDFDWVKEIRFLPTSMAEGKNLYLPQYATVSDLSGAFCKKTGRYYYYTSSNGTKSQKDVKDEVTPYTLYASLKFFSDPEFKNPVSKIENITEDTTVYVKLYGCISDNKGYSEYKTQD